MIRSSDKISLQWVTRENELELHYLASPSTQDQNFDDIIWRKIYVSTVSSSQLNIDEFKDRCIFRILKHGANDICDVLCFGDMIHLMHESTGFYLCDNFLCPGRTNNILDEELESLWIVQSRYKVKSVGDVVESSDYIVLVRYVSKKTFFIGHEVGDITFIIKLNSSKHRYTSQLCNYDCITIKFIENDGNWTIEPDNQTCHPSYNPSANCSYIFKLTNSIENINYETLGWQIIMVASNTNELESNLIHDSSLVRLQHCITRRYLILINDTSELKYTCSTTYEATDPLNIFVLNKCKIKQTNQNEVINLSEFVTFTHRESQCIPMPIVNDDKCSIEIVKSSYEFKLAGALCLNLFESQIYRDIVFVRRFKLFLLSVKLFLSKFNNLDSNTLQSTISACSNILIWVMNDDYHMTQSFNWEDFTYKSSICIYKQNLIALLGVQIELLTLSFYIYDLSSQFVLSDGHQNLCDEYIYPCLSICIVNKVTNAHLFMHMEGCIHRIFQMFIHGWKVPLRVLLFTISTQRDNIILNSYELTVPLSCLRQLSKMNECIIDLLTILCHFNIYVDYGASVRSFRSIVMEALNIVIYTKFEIHSNLFSLRYCSGQWEILSDVQLDVMIEGKVWMLWRDIEYKRLLMWLNFLLSVCVDKDITMRSSINILLPAQFLVYMLHHSEKDRKIIILTLINIIYVNCDLLFKNRDEIYYCNFMDDQLDDRYHQLLFNSSDDSEATRHIFKYYIITALINISLTPDNDIYNGSLFHTIKDLLLIGFFDDDKEMLLKLLLTNLSTHLKSANNDAENFINSTKLWPTLLTLCEFIIDRIYAEILQIDIASMNAAKNCRNIDKLKLLQAINDSDITEIFLLISCHSESYPFAINLVNRFINKQIFGYTYKLQQIRINDTIIVGTSYDKEIILRINSYYNVIRKYYNIYINNVENNKEAVNPVVLKLLMQCGHEISTMCRRRRRTSIQHRSSVIVPSSVPDITSFPSVLNPLHVIHNGMVIMYDKIMQQVDCTMRNFYSSANDDTFTDEFDTSYFIEQQHYNFDPLVIGETFIHEQDRMSQIHFSILVCDIWHQIKTFMSDSTAWVLASESTKIFVDIFLHIIVDLLSISNNSYEEIEKYLKADNGEDTSFSITEWHYCAGMGKLAEYVLTYSALDALYLFPDTDMTLVFFQSIFTRYGSDQATSVTACKLLLAILLNSSYIESKYGLAEATLNYLMNQGCSFASYMHGIINERYFYTLKVISKSLVILNLTMEDQSEKINLISSCYKMKDGVTLLCSEGGLMLKGLITDILLRLYNTDAQVKIQLSYCFYNELTCIHNAPSEKCTEQLYISFSEYINLTITAYLHFFSSIEYDTEQYANSLTLRMIEKNSLNVDMKNKMKRAHILKREDSKVKQQFRPCVDDIIPLSTLEGIILLLDIICDRSNIIKAAISDVILNRFSLIDEINLLNLIGKACAITRNVSNKEHYACKSMGNKLKQSAVKLNKILFQQKIALAIHKEIKISIDMLLDGKNITALNAVMTNLIDAGISNSTNQMNTVREQNTLKMVVNYISRHENHAIVVDGTINEILELIQTFLTTDYEKFRKIRNLLISVGIIKSMTNALGRFHAMVSAEELRFVHNLIKISTLLTKTRKCNQSLKYFTKGEFIQLRTPLNCILVIMLKAANTTYINFEYDKPSERSLYVQILQFISKLAMNKKYFHYLLQPSNQDVNIIDTIVDICVTLLQDIDGQLKYVHNSDLYKMQIELSTVPELNHTVLLNSTSTNFVRKYIAFYDTTDCNMMDKFVTSLIHTYKILSKILEGYNITFDHVFRDEKIKITIFDTTLHLLEYFGAYRLECKVLLQDNSTLNLSATNPNKFISLYYHFLKKQYNIHHIDLGKIEAYHEKKSRTKWDNFKTTCMECEIEIIRFLTSLTNGRIKSTMTTLREAILENEKSFVILLQNMDTLFKNSNTCELGISYWAFFNQFDTKSYLKLDKWKTATPRGNSFYCCTVYVVDNNKRISKCIFQTPKIESLWKDREVKRFKKLLTYYEIARVGSIELKMVSFYDAMHKLLKFMRRKQNQQLFLNKHISWYIEAVSTNLRVIFLALTIILNIYYGLFLNYDHLATDVVHIRNLFGESSTYSFVPSVIPTSYPSAAPTLAYSIDNTIALQRIVSNILTSNIIQISIQMSHLVVVLVLTIKEIRSSDEFDNLLKSCKRLNYQKTLSLVHQLILKYVWLIILLLCSTRAAIAGNTFLYSIALLDIINHFPIMKYVVESIRRNTYRISATLILSFILLWMFSTINIIFFPPNSYNFNGHEACHLNLADCIKLHIDYGFINSPNWITNGYYNSTDGNYDYGAGSIKTNIRGINTGYPLVTNILDNIIASGFNLLYVLSINLVLQSIISGLIIDTFSTMREEEDAKLDDIQNRCFICSLPRDVIEKTETFTDHIKDHYQWNYLFFTEYLEKKDQKSLSAPEHFAYECLNSRQRFSQILPYNVDLADQDTG